MSNPRIIILADGPGTRWTNKIPKHMAVVEGEAILPRTVRQLGERNQTDIWLTSRLDMYDALLPSVQRYVPIDNIFKLDQFYACRKIWSGLEDVIFLYGDVRFSDAAIDTILGTVPKDFAYFQRTNASAVTGKRWKEGFAMRVRCTQKFEHILRFMRGELESLHAKVADHHVQGFLEGMGMGPFYGIGPHGVEIDDETDDFDYPMDVQIWTQNVTRWRNAKKGTNP